MSLTHTKACLDKQASRQRKIERWKAKWPNHCRYCKAQTDCEMPCPHCLLQLTCPRCGTEDAMDPEDAAVPCLTCGWRDGHAPDACPEEYECRCRVWVIRKDEEESRRLRREIAEKQRELDRLNKLLRS